MLLLPVLLVGRHMRCLGMLLAEVCRGMQLCVGLRGHGRERGRDRRLRLRVEKPRVDTPRALRWMARVTGQMRARVF